MNEMITLSRFESLMSELQNKNLAELLDFLKQTKTLGAALKAAKLFKENAVRFAVLEAEALIRVAELGGTAELKGIRRNTAEWLFSLSEEDRQKYIAMCSDGLMITQVWKREVQAPADLDRTLDVLQDLREDLVDDLSDHGIVDMTQYSQIVRSHFNGKKNSPAEDIIAGTRGALLRKGAVGCGDNTYVLPSAEISERLTDAVKVRYKSVSDDLEAMFRLINASGMKFSYKMLKRQHRLIDVHPAEALVLLCLALNGDLEDGDELIRRVFDEGSLRRCRPEHIETVRRCAV